MNSQLIEKVIISNDFTCPVFTYENSLLDRNVAQTLAKSFIKMLRVSQSNSNLNTNLRHSVLANIRKICRIEPENHLDIDDNLTDLLRKVYVQETIENRLPNTENSLEKILDDFLLRTLKDLDSKYKSSLNPEVLQALMNLNEDYCKLEILFKDVLHWDVSNAKIMALIKDIWIKSCLDSAICDDISIKMKSFIEVTLLNFCHSILTDPNAQIMQILSTDDSLKQLVIKCCVSAECFQMCVGILNHLFCNTNFNMDIGMVISTFIQLIKEKCFKSLSVLYPAHLSFIVVLLDFELNISKEIKSKYIEQTIPYLKKLQEHSEADLIMLLSHFPQWYEIYFHP